MDLPGRVDSSPTTARTRPATEPDEIPLAAGRPTSGVASPLIAYRLGEVTLPIEPAPVGRDWMTATDQHFANRCLPLLMANQSGWVLLNNAGLTARWSGDDALRGVDVSYDDGQWPLVGSFFGYGILTWSIPYVIRTPRGWDLLVRGPANSPKHGIAPLEGLVETDWSSSTFTMNWKFTAPDIPVRFEIGEPICMIVPQRRGALEEFRPVMMPVEADPELHRRHLAWARSRHDFLVRRADGWQKDYVHGQHATGESAGTSHRTRAHLSRFDPADETRRPPSPSNEQ